MSERGSFVTEYIYCPKCFQAAKSVLLAREKSLCSVAIPHWNQEKEGPELPIIAGKIGHAWSIAHAMEHEIAPDLIDVLCHPLRIAVLEECRQDYIEEAKTVVVRPRAQA
jgi:hypothetical protein